MNIGFNQQMQELGVHYDLIILFMLQNISAKPWFYHINCKAVSVVYPICPTSAYQAYIVSLYDLHICPILYMSVSSELERLSHVPIHPVIDHFACYRASSTAPEHAVNFPKNELLDGQNTVRA